MYLKNVSEQVFLQTDAFGRNTLYIQFNLSFAKVGIPAITDASSKRNSGDKPIILQNIDAYQSKRRGERYQQIFFHVGRIIRHYYTTRSVVS